MFCDKVKVIVKNNIKCVLFMFAFFVVLILGYRIWEEHRLKGTSTSIKMLVENIEQNSTDGVKKELFELSDIVNVHKRMVKYEYRLNTLHNANAVGAVITGALASSPYKVSAGILGVADGVSIIYAKRLQELKDECEDRYSLIDDIVNTDTKDVKQIYKIKNLILEKSTICVY
jgi:hypothetical protein